MLSVCMIRSFSWGSGVRCVGKKLGSSSLVNWKVCGSRSGTIRNRWRRRRNGNWSWRQRSFVRNAVQQTLTFLLFIVLQLGNASIVVMKALLFWKTAIWLRRYVIVIEKRSRDEFVAFVGNAVARLTPCMLLVALGSAIQRDSIKRENSPKHWLPCSFEFDYDSVWTCWAAFPSIFRATVA